MTSFIIIATLITLFTLAALIWPLLRTRNTVSYARQEQNIHYAKERLEELDAQLKGASISATDYEALKLEIESTLAHDIDIANNSPVEEVAGPRRSNKVAISILATLLPLAAFGFYYDIGTPAALKPAAVVAEIKGDQQQIDVMIAGVEQRLKENPNDIEGWQILSQTYLALGRYEEARSGFQQVLALGGKTDHIYASLADATALSSGGQFTPEVKHYIEQALALNPVNRQALWLAGLAAARGGDPETANKHWQKLMPLLADSPSQQQELHNIIEETIGQSGSFTNSGLNNGNVSDDNGTQTAKDTPDNIAQSDANLANDSASLTSDSASKGIKVDVALDPQLALHANANDFVFIFAKAQQGPPAPLAVKRLRVSDLPILITLSDADAMIAAMTISKFEDCLLYTSPSPRD